MLFRRSLPSLALSSLLLVPTTFAALTGGKIVFTSNRVTPTQLFVTVPGLNAPPVQVTSGFYEARHPRWSPNGKFIAYITSDVIVGNGSSQLDVLNIIAEDGMLLLTVPMFKFAGAQNLGYPQWADDGRRIVLTFFLANGTRGLGLVTFPGPYQFGNPPQTDTLIAPGGNINPGEAVFSRNGATIYFSGDAFGDPALLFAMPASGGTPSPIFSGSSQVRRLFAPSISPDGIHLIYNSERWKDLDPNNENEEVLDLHLGFLTIQQITNEAGNQYAWFARNGAGEMVVQSNTTPSAIYYLFLQDFYQGGPTALDVGPPVNGRRDGSPDWWKPYCGGGTALWVNGEAVGCKFPTWGADQINYCGAWTPLLAKNNGKCNICIDSTYTQAVLSGKWSGIMEGTSAATATPADLACRACIKPPPQLAGWWAFDEVSGPTAMDRSSASAHGTHIGAPVPTPGRVSRALRFNGTTAYVQAPNTASLNPSLGNFSIDAWIRIETASSLNGIRTIVEKREQNPYFRGYSFFLYNGALGLQLADGIGSQYSNFISTVSVPADGKWHFVAVTVNRFNTQGGRFYLDGTPVSAPFNPMIRAGSLTTGVPLRIGSSTLSVSSLFKGSIDEVEVFRSVLQPSDIQKLYTVGECGKCK